MSKPYLVALCALQGSWVMVDLWWPFKRRQAAMKRPSGLWPCPQVAQHPGCYRPEPLLQMRVSGDNLWHAEEMAPNMLGSISQIRPCLFPRWDAWRLSLMPGLSQMLLWFTFIPLTSGWSSAAQCVLVADSSGMFQKRWIFFSHATGNRSFRHYFPHNLNSLYW